MTRTERDDNLQWLDSNEYDPCIAAERRMETSFSSTRLLYCLFTMLLTLTVVVGMVIYIMASGKNLSDLHQIKIEEDLGSIESRQSDYIEEINSETIMHGTKSVVLNTQQTSLSRTDSRTTKKILSPIGIPRFSSPESEETKKHLSADGFRRDCDSWRMEGFSSGVYRIQLGPKIIVVQCLMDDSGRAWTILHKRVDGKIEFYNRTWEEYRSGFGRVETSYWMGLESLYQMMPSDGSMLRLRIELHGDFCASKSQCSGQPNGSWTGEWNFKIGSAATNYMLHLSSAKEGSLSEGPDYFHLMHHGHPFTTFDRDNDKKSEINCAIARNFGGWWHNDCGYMALNGMYGDTAPKRRYQYWYHQKNKISYYIHPKQSIMMFRSLY